YGWRYHPGLPADPARRGRNSQCRSPSERYVPRSRCSSDFFCYRLTLLRTGGVRRLQQTLLGLGEVAEALLPLGRLVDTGCLNSRDLVLGTVGCPIRAVRRNDVRAGFREVEGCVHNARLHAVSDSSAQHRITGAAGNSDPVTFDDSALLSV